MTAFDQAAAALFANPDMAINATYRPVTGQPVSCRIIMADPVKDVSSFSSDVQAIAPTLDLRTADVATPKVNDRIDLADGRSFKVKSAMRESSGQIWTLSLLVIA